MSKTNGGMKCFRLARRLSDRQTAAVSLSPLPLFLDLFAQSDTGSLFMCKFALGPYKGGVHAESLLFGL